MTVRALAVGTNNTDQVDHRSLVLSLVETDGSVNSRAGVFPSSPGPAALSNVSAMVVGVGPFKAVVPNQYGSGMHLVQSDAVTNLTFDAGEASVARTDRIIVRVYNADQDSNTAGSGGTALYDARVEYLKGQVSGSATALPQGALLLWEVPVPAGASAGGGGINFTGIAVDKRVYTSSASGVIVVPLASDAASITNPYHGMIAYARDLNTFLVHDGTNFKVRGQLNVSSSSALTNVPNPYDGLIAVARDTNDVWQYTGTAWVKITGGNSGFLIPAFKTTTQNVNNSATLVNDTQLFVPLEANSRYVIEGWLSVGSPANADFKFGFTFPSGSTEKIMTWNEGYSNKYEFTISGEAVAFATNGDPEADHVYISGSIITGANAGNLQLQWAQNAAVASNTSVVAGSWIRAHKVG